LSILDTFGNDWLQAIVEKALAPTLISGQPFMNKVANIVLKMDKIGNSVPKNYVTPAEVMFLTADHHANAGGDPIVALEEIELSTDEAGLKQAQIQLEKVEAQRAAVDEDMNITPEVRHSRLESLNHSWQASQDAVAKWKNRLGLRKLDSSAEKRRLSAIYGGARVSRVFPGSIPALPETYEQAKMAGVASSTGDAEDKFIMMSEGAR
jgi:hypothetical protein